MRTTLCLLLCSLLTAYSAISQDQNKYSTDVQKKISEVETHLAGWVQTGDAQTWTLQDRMRYYRLKAVSIAVVNNYKIEWAKAYGLADSAEQRPATTATLFQAASLSKSLNGVGVLKLVQQGRLDLDSNVNIYLRTWKFPDSGLKGKKITAAELLSHTAGLSVHGFAGYAKGDSIPDIYQILDGKHPANSAPVRSLIGPGIRSQYSGGGITLSQLIVQDITGQPYDKFMWENVLRPMGMTSSSYTQPPPAAKAGLLATGYRNYGQEITGKYHIYPEQAAAGLWTNPTDLCHYIIATQRSYEGKDNSVLTQAITIRRLTPYIDSSAALGVFIAKKGDATWFSHGGANEGFRCQYYGSLQGGRGVVVMVNSDNGDILNEIINSVARVYSWTGFYQPVAKKEITPADTTFNLYTGRYTIGYDTVKLIKKEGKLWLDQGFAQWVIHFTTNEQFFLYEDRSDFEFTRTAGKVDGILINHKNKVIKID